MLVVSPNPRSIVNIVIKSHTGSKPISVLEAGGGSRCRLQQSGGINISTITTIDIDGEQLRKNDYADEKLLEDLQTFKSKKRYDVIEIVNVVEHIEDLEAALNNVIDCCNPGGLIVIGAPYLYSFSGFVTRFSPHFFHVFYRKYMLREENAGKKGYGPFPTFYNPLVAPQRLKAFFSERGCDLQLEMYYSSKRLDRVWKNCGVASWPLFFVIYLINLVTPKAYDTRNGEFYMIFHKGELL